MMQTVVMAVFPSCFYLTTDSRSVSWHEYKKLGSSQFIDLRLYFVVAYCRFIHRINSQKSIHFIPWVAAQSVRWSGTPKVARSLLTQCSKSCDLQPSPHCTVQTWSSGGTVLCRVGGATSQLDLPSLTPLYVADCGWLQLGAPHWATSVKLLQVVDNWTHILWW